MTFLNELALIGCYTDEHVDEYDGDTYKTPSLIDHDTGYTPTHAEMLDAWTAYTKRGQGIRGRDAALGEYLRFMHRTRQEGRQ